MLNHSGGKNTMLNNHRHHHPPPSPMNLPFPHPEGAPSSLPKRNLFQTSCSSSSSQHPTLLSSTQHQLPLLHLPLAPPNIPPANMSNFRQSLPIFNHYQHSLSIPARQFHPSFVEQQSQSQQSYDYLRHSLVSPSSFCDCSSDSMQLQRSLIKSQYLQQNCKCIERNTLDAERQRYFQGNRMEQQEEEMQQQIEKKQQHWQEQQNYQGDNQQQFMLEQHYAREQSQQIASQQKQNYQERSLHGGSIHGYADVCMKSLSLSEQQRSQELQQHRQQISQSREAHKRRRNRQRINHLANHNNRRELSRSITSSSQSSSSSSAASSGSSSSSTSRSSISNEDNTTNNNICSSPRNALKDNTKRKQQPWSTTRSLQNPICNYFDQITTHRSKLPSHRQQQHNRTSSKSNRLRSNNKRSTAGNQNHKTPERLAEHRELLKIQCAKLMKEIDSNKQLHEIFQQNTKDSDSDELRALITERSYPEALLILLRIILQISQRIKPKNNSGVDVLVIDKKDSRYQTGVCSPQSRRQQLSDQRQSQQRPQSQLIIEGPPPTNGISSSSQFQSQMNKDHHQQQRFLSVSQQTDNISQRCNTEPAVVSSSHSNCSVSVRGDGRQLHKLRQNQGQDPQQYYLEHSAVLQDSQYEPQIRQHRFQEFSEGSEGKDSQIIRYEYQEDEDSEGFEQEGREYKQQQTQEQSNSNADIATDSYRANFESFTIPLTAAAATAYPTELHKMTFSPHFSKEEEAIESDHIPLQRKHQGQLQELNDNTALQRKTNIKTTTEKIKKFNIDQDSISSSFLSYDKKHDNQDPKKRLGQQSLHKGSNKVDTSRDNSKNNSNTLTKNSSKKCNLNLMPCLKIKAGNHSQNLQQENINSRFHETGQKEEDKQQPQVMQVLSSRTVRSMYLNESNSTMGSSPRNAQVIHSARYSNEDNSNNYKNNNNCQNVLKLDALFKKKNAQDQSQQQNGNTQKRSKVAASEQKTTPIVGIEFAGMKKKVPLLPKQQRVFDIISGCELTDRSN